MNTEGSSRDRQLGSNGLRYGVDGFPYVAGLSATAVLAGVPSVAAVLTRTGCARRMSWIGCAVAAAAAVPAGLGIRYVVTGKPALRERMLGAVAWTGSETVADLGCGRGLLAVGAATRTTGTVHAVDLFITKDLSGNRPEQLLANAARAGVDRQLEVHRADVRHTGLPDHSVDVVLSALCLHNIADPAGRRAALTEIARILRPGGTVVISDLAHVDDEYAPQLRQHRLQVQLHGRVPNTFPPQQMLVARRARS